MSDPRIGKFLHGLALGIARTHVAGTGARDDAQPKPHHESHGSSRDRRDARAPLIGGVLIGSFGTWAPGLLSALLMLWSAIFIVRRFPAAPRMSPAATSA